MKDWIIRRLISNVLVLPAAIINYAIVYLALVVFHQTSLAGFSIVIVADVVALILNNYLVDFNIRFAMRFKSYREYVQKNAAK